MSFLKRLKVSHALILSTLLPMLVAVVLLVILLFELNDRVRSARLVEDIVTVSELFDAVAHNHAVERGLTAGFLGSNGANGRDRVNTQRAVADQASVALLEFDTQQLQTFSAEEFEALVEPIREQLAEKSSVRNAVDQLSPDNGAFAFYSELNRRALTAIGRLGVQITNAEDGVLMDSRLQLLWMKERAGQYRGALNGIFSSGQTNAMRKQAVSGYIADEANRLEVFLSEARPADADALRQLRSSPTWTQVANATEAFQSAEDLTNIQGPQNWFEMATQRIGDIKALSDRIGSDLVSQAQVHTSEALWLRNGLVVLFLVVMLPVLWLGRKVRQSITQRVDAIQQFLDNVSDQKSFDHLLEDDAHDEISQIVRALNAHVQEISRSLMQIQEQALSSSHVVDSIRENSVHILDDARAQYGNTDQIATAMAEMSQTSHVIASDMQMAAEETKTVQEHGQQGSARITQITKSMGELDEEINQTFRIVEEVSEKTSGINQILQTIESIAEQTNLLALNAAIEAARAGEQGRGFAVVADEVRSLASRTQGSTVEIREMIEGLLESSGRAIRSMDHCKALTDSTASKVTENSEMIQELFRSVDRLNESIEKVATAAEEQSQVSEDINRNVQRVADGSQTILEATENNDRSVADLVSGFADVNREISQYRLQRDSE